MSILPSGALEVTFYGLENFSIKIFEKLLSLPFLVMLNDFHRTKKFKKLFPPQKITGEVTKSVTSFIHLKKNFCFRFESPNTQKYLKESNKTS